MYNYNFILFCYCFYRKLKGIDNKINYSNILLNLLTYKSSDVVLHTYSFLNNIIKKLLNNFQLDSHNIDQLIANILTTDILNEILCFGCFNSNEQVKLFRYICSYVK